MAGVPLPDPPLGDGVVVLRPFSVGDAPSLLSLWEDAEVARWTVVPAAPSVALAEAWIETRPSTRARGAGLDLVIADATSDAFCGAVSLDGIALAARTSQAAYSLLPAHRGAGRATRALSLLVGWALADLGLVRVELEVDEANAASRAVAARAGFAPSGPRRWTRQTS